MLVGGCGILTKEVGSVWVFCGFAVGVLKKPEAVLLRLCPAGLGDEWSTESSTIVNSPSPTISVLSGNC